MKLPNYKLGRELAKTLRASRGFTMIELLVVIAVIGVLAVAVLSSINPIEQINKGRDTRTRSDAAQMINATDRFFAVHEIYPWNDATYNSNIAADGIDQDAFPGANAGGGTNCTATGIGFCIVDGTAANDSWLDALTGTAEVKQGYVNRVRAVSTPNELNVFKAAGINQTTYVCFIPSSQAFQTEALDRCVTESALLPPGACQNGPYNPTSTYVDEMVCLP